MKAAKDAGEEYYDPMREDNIKGRNKTRLALWGEHLKDPIVALDKESPKVRGRSVVRPMLSRGSCGLILHSLYALECPREVRALWRALLLPFEERADGPQGVGSVWA